MRTPSKPFDSYKWQWATLQPSEGLNNPPVFLGVLKAMGDHEGQSPRSEGFDESLRILQEETGSEARLEAEVDPDGNKRLDRHLIRRFLQYWIMPGLATKKRGKIKLTDYGRAVAKGEVTATEFAVTTIKTLELPSRVQANASVWRDKGLKIKPLELILRVVLSLKEVGGEPEAYITPFELEKIVVPLAGDRAPLDDFVNAILQQRKGLLDVTGWPNCTPKGNDPRMVREFLLFLANYEFLTLTKSPPKRSRAKKIGSRRARLNLDDRLVMLPEQEEAVRAVLSLSVPSLDPALAFASVAGSSKVALVYRAKVMVAMLNRSKQADFRRKVLRASFSACAVTGFQMAEVLEAAHIIPVQEGGTDEVENGLCLRADIHRLYDSGHLRIKPSGEIALSDVARLESNYGGGLPSAITLPPSSADHVAWHWKYRPRGWPEV